MVRVPSSSIGFRRSDGERAARFLASGHEGTAATSQLWAVAAQRSGDRLGVERRARRLTNWPLSRYARRSTGYR